MQASCEFTCLILFLVKRICDTAAIGRSQATKVIPLPFGKEFDSEADILVVWERRYGRIENALF